MHSDPPKAEGSARQFPRRGLWLGLILILLAGGLLLTAHYTLRQDKPVAQPKAEPTILERKLPSGTICRVALYGTNLTAGRAEKLERLEVSISGKPVYIPTEAFSDLQYVAVQDGVQIAEFAGETYVLLSGGEGASAWLAKLTIRDHRVTERDLTRGNAQSEVARYASPPVISPPLPLTTRKAISVQLSQPQKLPNKQLP